MCRLINVPLRNRTFQVPLSGKRSASDEQAIETDFYFWLPELIAARLSFLHLKRKDFAG